jgi:hypothetical protein
MQRACARHVQQDILYRQMERNAFLVLLALQGENHLPKVVCYAALDGSVMNRDCLNVEIARVVPTTQRLAAVLAPCAQLDSTLLEKSRYNRDVQSAPKEPFP